MTIQNTYSTEEKYTIYAIVTDGKLQHFAYEGAGSYIEGFETAADAIKAAQDATK